MVGVTPSVGFKMVQWLPSEDYSGGTVHRFHDSLPSVFLGVHDVVTFWLLHECLRSIDCAHLECRDMSSRGIHAKTTFLTSSYKLWPAGLLRSSILFSWSYWSKLFVPCGVFASCNQHDSRTKKTSRRFWAPEISVPMQLVGPKVNSESRATCEYQIPFVESLCVTWIILN